jgi:tripartite-type tricarboxylate transporter receptor subunit TctC
MSVRSLLASAVMAFAIGLGAGAQAQGQAASGYEVLGGRTIRFIIGGSPGGTTDNYGRPVAEGLKALLPDSDVLVQTFGGGGGSVLALVEAATASDATINLVVIQNGPIYDQLLGSETLPVDVGRFHAVGSLTHDQRILAVHSSLGVTTFEDALALAQPLVTPVANATSPGNIEALLLGAVTGLKLDIVVGVDNATRETMLLAGETDADINSYVNLKPLIDSGVIVPVLRMSRDGYPPELDSVETLDAVVDPGTPEALIDLVDSLNRLGRLVVAAPGTSPAEVDALRLAFDRIMASPELRDAYDRQKLVLVPTTGTDVQLRLDALLADPEAAAMFRSYVDCGERRAAGEAIACPAP